MWNKLKQFPGGKDAGDQVKTGLVGLIVPGRLAELAQQTTKDGRLNVKGRLKFLRA